MGTLLRGADMVSLCVDSGEQQKHFFRVGTLFKGNLGVSKLC